MKIKMMPIGQVLPYEKNPRRNEQAVDGVAASIQEFGWRQPIVVDEDGVIIVGHTRLMAAEKLGLDKVPVHVAEGLTPEQVKAYRIADNRTGEDAEWDEELLKAELESLKDEDFDLSLTGFNTTELEQILIQAVTVLPPATPPDETQPELPEEPDTVSGDLYEIGPHRLLCGDSSSHSDVERLMGGEKADLVFTDPPYNLAEKTNLISQPNAKSHKVLKNSDWDKGFDIQEVLANLLPVLQEDVSVYICTSHFIAPDIWQWMATWASYNGFCVWTKPNPMPSLMKKCWTWNCELVCYAHRGDYTFNFPAEGHALQSWSINKIQKSDLHPTMKPVDVPKHAIIHSSNEGDLVLDLFGGSGTTMIAAQETGRRAYLMELSPKYCEVIVERMHKLWPTLPVKRNGVPIEF